MSINLARDDNALTSAFDSLTCLEDIATLLELPPKTLRFFLYKKQAYSTFDVPKRSGGARKISTPESGLKIVQRKLNQVLHAVYRRRSPVHGFVKGRSVKSNARRHLGSEWLLNIDLQDFFPSINFGRVQGLFKSAPYNLPLKAASVLAQICCHNGILPTGAPTSPTISNMVCGKLDADLKKLARQNGCIYTRYADDITISTQSKHLSPKIAYRDNIQRSWKVGDDLSNAVTQNGSKINPQKTKVRNRQGRLEVTGIRINKGLNVPKALIKQVRSMLHAWEQYGEESAEASFWNLQDKKHRKTPLPPFRSVVRGKLEYIGFIRGRDHTSYVRLLQRLQKLQPSAHSKPIWTGATSQDATRNLAVWLLYNYQKTTQGTAFAISKKYLITAAHCVEEIMLASQPAESAAQYLVTVEWKNEDLDIAILSIGRHIPVTLEIAPSRPLQSPEPVTLLGYPNHQENDVVSIRSGKITQSRHYFGILHYIIDADIVKGNSGGPVPDASNRVIGVAVKGVGVPGKFTDDDQLSSFVPIDSEMVRKTLATL